METFTFGKYKGCKVINVCHDNPHYCLWADLHVPFFSLTEEQKQLAERKCLEKEQAKADLAEEVYGFGGNGF